MICPYCNLDMEPIELNGKVFCSNCGMTIESSPSSLSEKEPPVINHVETQEDVTDKLPESEITNEEPPKEVVNPYLLKKNQVPGSVSSLREAGENVLPDESESVKNELIKMIGGSEEPEVTEIVKNPPEDQPTEAANISEPVKVKVESVTPVQPPAPEPKVSIKQEEGLAKEDKSSDDSVGPTAPNAVSDSSEHLAAKNIEKEEPVPKASFDDNVKKIDTLGASGVLLDILDDSALEKQKEQKVKTLKAAEDLIDDLPMPQPKPETIPANAEATIEKPFDSDFPVMTPEEMRASLTGSQLSKKRNLPETQKPPISNIKTSEKDRQEAMVATTAEDLKKDQAYNSRKDQGQSKINAGLKTSPLTNYFSSVFAKKDK